MPVLDMLPMACWVNGMRHKQTMWAWDNVYLAKLAVIVPIQEAVVDDASAASRSKTTCLEAISIRVDQAAISALIARQWRAGIITSFRAAGAGTAWRQAATYNALLRKNWCNLPKVETNMVNSAVAAMLHGKTGRIKTTEGMPIF